MDMTFAGTQFARPRAGRPIATADAAVHPAPRAAPGYAPRHDPLAIGLVVAAHLGLLWALIHFDVVAIGRAKPPALEVTMVPAAPPPSPHEAAKPAPARKALTPLVASPPVVRLDVAAPPPIVFAPPPPVPAAAPDPMPAVAAASAPPAAAPGPMPVDLLADVIEAPPPRFPTESRRLRESGTVRLRVTVSSEGRPSDVAVARSSGFARLDEAAAAAVRRWRFRARVVAGVAAEVIGFVPVTFNPPH